MTERLPTDSDVQMRPVARAGSRRWLVAIGVALAALLGTAAAFFVASGAAPVSRLAGWSPAGTVSYAELRLDGPGDQGASFERFLANFPGFADRTRLDEKLTQLGDELAAEITDGKITYSSLKPWLGDALAVAVTRAPATKDDRPGLLLVAVKDPAALRDWIAANVPAGGTTESYRGVALTVGTTRGMEWAWAVLDTVFLAGERRSVEAAIETAGASPFVTSEPFQTAIGALEGPAVGIGFVDGDALVEAALAADPGNDALDSLARDAVPAWIGAALHFRDDRLEAELVAPRSALLAGSGDGASPTFPPLTNESSAIARLVPGDAIAMSEVRDVGPLLVALAARLPSTLEGSGGSGVVDGLLGLAGNSEALVGWMGDAALVVRPGADGLEAGVVARTTDSAAASATVRQIGALISLAALGEGVSIGSEPYGDGEITTVVIADPTDLLGGTGLLGATGSALPAGMAEWTGGSVTLAWTVQRDRFVAGSSTAFVKAALDTTEASSLAGVARYRSAIERAGVSNAGEAYLDVPALVERMVPLLPETMRATYDRTFAPFAAELDGAAAASLAGDPMRVRFVLTVR